ncbi:MAG TPA: SMP-30/gluconolactonase/LRE family protein [Terriglobales bacterium]|nr:SMP-30/gluconolactonase/LRE family protein [Terriglobales bacterium]
MKTITFLALLLFVASSTKSTAEDYVLGPDSQRQPNVPKGSVTKYSWTSKIYPGTARDYWLYIPAQYKPDKPACVMIFQDGGRMVDESGSWRTSIVFDNLIAKGEMPVTIGIFIDPGVLPAASPNQQNRYNRSFEYDALGDRYARFLKEEILPEVEKRFRLSKDPNDYALAGASSGGIAAFNAAWNRPDSFRRVLSFIGSFTNLRGAETVASLIRKTEPKPLRVFLQDGRNDLNIYSGSWFIANQDVYAALEFAGYESNFAIGTEGHNGKHGGAILPDALRWLWKDYPKPVPKPIKVNERGVYQILDPGKEWELLGEGFKFSEGPAVDREGNVYFTDIPNNRIHKIDLNGKITVWRENSGGANGMMFGPDGRLYVCQNGQRRIVAYSSDGTESVLAEDVDSNDLAVTVHNEVYFTDPPNHRVWFIDSKGNKRIVFTGIEFPNGVRLSPDQSLLTVADTRGKWLWSFQIQPDGSLANGEQFYRLETPDDSSQSLADGMTYDTEGFLYVATKLGVQVCDQPGRVNAIISNPQDASLSNVVFGGPDMQWLYVTNRDKVYRRHMLRKGSVSWNLIKPPMPQL